MIFILYFLSRNSCIQSYTTMGLFRNQPLWIITCGFLKRACYIFHYKVIIQLKYICCDLGQFSRLFYFIQVLLLHFDSLCALILFVLKKTLSSGLLVSDPKTSSYILSQSKILFYRSFLVYRSVYLVLQITCTSLKPFLIDSFWHYLDHKNYFLLSGQLPQLYVLSKICEKCCMPLDHANEGRHCPFVLEVLGLILCLLIKHPQNGNSAAPNTHLSGFSI